MLCSSPAPTATKPRVAAVRKSQKLADQASSSKGDKKERDPALPKKPSNPFFWFCQEHRAAVQEQCARESSAGHHELTKALARMWNDTSEEDKKASCLDLHSMLLCVSFATPWPSTTSCSLP